MGIIDAIRQSGVKVAVLCGGPGAEREVSLNSGEVAYQALAETGMPCEKLIVPANGADAFLHTIDCGLAVLMLHGEFGEDGTAQAILEQRGIAYTGSDSKASALAMDKNGSKLLFKQNGIPTPRWVVADDEAVGVNETMHRGLKFPLFVKPNYRGSSVGVSRVDDPSGLKPALAKALAEDRLAMVEEMVQGRELTVSWLDGQTLPIIELSAKETFYDYYAKYQSEETGYVCPAELPDETAERVNAYVAAAAAALDARDVARVDVMLGRDGPMLLELNTLPGFTTHSLLPMAGAKAGMDRSQLCLKLVEMAAARIGIE